MSAGRATVSGHRAVLKHEAKMWEDGVRESGGTDRKASAHRHHHAMLVSHALPHAPCARQGRVVIGGEFDIVPTVEANGNDPISPLSVAADSRCVSVRAAIGEAATW